MDEDEVFAEVVASIFEREAQHWELEYEALARKGSSYGRKEQAAWKLGAAMLRRRSEQYRSGTVRYLVGLEEPGRSGSPDA